MKSMISAYQFQKNISHFFTDLQKAQLIALSDRVDIDLKIVRKKGSYTYSFATDNPLSHFTASPKKMTGIKEIKRGKKQTEELALHIFPSGRVEPEEKIAFLERDNQGVIIDFTAPLCIEIKRMQKFETKEK